MNKAPDFVYNVMGSSAGAGSGEFHVYRNIRRKEYERQRVLDERKNRHGFQCMHFLGVLSLQFLKAIAKSQQNEIESLTAPGGRVGMIWTTHSKSRGRKTYEKQRNEQQKRCAQSLTIFKSLLTLVAKSSLFDNRIVRGNWPQGPSRLGRKGWGYTHSGL